MLKKTYWISFARANGSSFLLPRIERSYFTGLDRTRDRRNMGLVQRSRRVKLDIAVVLKLCTAKKEKLLNSKRSRTAVGCDVILI